MLRQLTLLTCAVVLALGMAACGDDDDDDGDAASGDNAAYCEATLKIETVPEPEVDFESLTEEQQKEEAKKFARETLRPLADDIVDVVPADIEADVAVLSGAVDKIAETGDFSVFDEDPATLAAERRVHAFDLDNCGWDSTAVTAVDYAFQGVPATIESGIHSFDLSNKGKEFHEFILLKKNDGVTKTFDELLELPQEEAEESVTNIAGVFQPPAGPGDYAITDLDAGEYLAVCFIPEGTTSEESESEGPPHFTKGMKAEFTVS